MLTRERSIDRVHLHLESQPRERLAFLPTPLELLPRLSEQLGIQLWMKRDDQTGVALGGNKARKLEYLTADALRKGADTLVTTGGSQSNHARITAAACRKLGLDCYLVLDRGMHPENGNLLLDELFGAHVELIDSADPADATAGMEALATELRGQGRTPYIVPRGGSVPAGATGYVRAMVEMAQQLDDLGVKADALYLATGSCGTHAGVMAGVTALGLPLRVEGISVSRTRAAQESRVRELANATLEYLELPERVDEASVHVDDGFVGDGYGHPTAAMWKALRTVARAEGIVLDPVYSGKAMAGLLGHVQSGKVQAGAQVVFLHTGGTPAVFAYNQEMMENV